MAVEGGIFSFALMFFGNGKALTKAMQILPSAMRQWRRHGYCFSFPCGMFLMVLVMAWRLGFGCVLKFSSCGNVIGNLYGSETSRSHCDCCSGQMKNNTLASFLVLWVLKMAFTLGSATEMESHFYNLQNQ
jgi:hypothetical protein